MAEIELDINLEGLEFRDRLLKTSVTKTQLLRLAMKGLNATQAAKVVGCSAETARGHYADPEFRRAVLSRVEQAFEGIDQAFIERRKDLHELLEEQAYRSCEELMQLVEDPQLHPSLKVKIHQDFLNRHEDTKPLSGKSFKFDAGELRHASRVAQEMDKVIPMPMRKQA